MSINPRLKHEDPIIMGGTKVFPGEIKEAQIQVSRLPAGTMINIEPKIYRSNNPGPTVLVIAGVHGDEINGIQIVRESILNEVFNNLDRGSVIAIPILNIFGFINFSREVPDGKDINRSFPGFKNGSLASRVAYALTRNVMPYVDCIMDFHTGGSSRYNYPQIRYAGRDTFAGELARAFSPKFILQKSMIPKSLRKISFNRNIHNIVYEGGESVRLDGHAIDYGLHGMKNVLHHLQMINHTPDGLEEEEKILCTKTTWIRAPYSGVFIWCTRSGVYVKKGETLGTIGDPYGNNTVKVIANRDGYIVGHNNAAVVNQGDALFHQAYEYEIL